MKVLGVDPGDTTGYVIVDTVSGQVLYGTFPVWSGLESLVLSLEPSDAIVFESFRLYPAKAQAQSWSSFPAVEVIGVLKFLARKQHVPIVEQSASEGKSVDVDIDQRSVGRHAYDALRHVLVYLRRQGVERFNHLIRIRPSSETIRSRKLPIPKPR